MLLLKLSDKQNYSRAFKYLIEEGKDPANVDENGDELEMDEDDSEGMFLYYVMSLYLFFL